MSSSPAKGWSWDARRLLYYFWDEQRGQNVYWDAQQRRPVLLANEERMPRSITSPQESLAQPSRQTPGAASGYSLSSSGTTRAGEQAPDPFAQAPTRPVAHDQSSISRGTTSPMTGSNIRFLPRAPNSDFQRRRQHFFSVGRVFDVLWSNQAGEDVSQAGSTVVGDDSNVIRIQRMVVLRERDTYCSVLPITTYGGRGVGKPGVVKSEHGIIYTGRSAPEPLPNEMPSRNEEPMKSTGIRVTPDAPDIKLARESRIHYAKIYNVEYNSPVKAFGVVHISSKASMELQFREVFLNRPLEISPSQQPYHPPERTSVGVGISNPDRSTGPSQQPPGAPEQASSGVGSSNPDRTTRPFQTPWRWSTTFQQYYFERIDNGRPVFVFQIGSIVPAPGATNLERPSALDRGAARAPRTNVGSLPEALRLQSRSAQQPVAIQRRPERRNEGEDDEEPSSDEGLDSPDEQIDSSDGSDDGHSSQQQRRPRHVR